MSAVSINIDITDYLPSSVNFEGFTFTFKSDDKTFEDSISYAQKNSLSHQITNIKKDTRYSIKVLKNGGLAGIAEFSVYQLSLIKRESVITKTIGVTLTEQMKRTLFGNTQKTGLKLAIKAMIQYPDDIPLGSSAVVQMDKEKTLSTSAHKPSATVPKTSASSQSAKGDASKPNSNSNQKGSLPIVKELSKKLPEEEKEKPQVIEQNESIDLSKIDDVFENDIEEIDLKLQDFITHFNDKFTKDTVNEIEDEVALKEKAKDLVLRLFDLQRIYYEEFNNSVSVNKRLRELLVKYNEKYRTMLKKQNRLREQLESNSIRHELTAFLNKEENERVSEAFSLNKAELKIYQSLFNVFYGDYELKKYQVEKESAATSAEADKTFLISLLKGLVNANPLLINKIPEEKKIHFSYIIDKYSLYPAGAVDQKPDEGMGPNANKNPRENDDRLEDVRPNENATATATANVAPQKKLSIVQSTNVDILDKKLDNYLLDFYSKKRVSQIPFRKISTGNYEYGTQKVMVKVEGETIRVRTGGGYILLDKFIEVYAPAEEAKLVKAQDITDKFKDNVGMNKLFGKDNPVYQINEHGNLSGNLKKPGAALPRSLTPNKK